MYSLPSACLSALVKESVSGSHVRFFAECCVGHSAKRASLPSAKATALGKEPIPVSRSWFFVECYGPDTWQSTSLPSVTLGKVTSTHLLICFSYSIQTNKRYITDITYIHHSYHHRHKYPTQILIYKFSTQTVLSGTIIRGTLKTPNSQLVTPISIKLQRPDGYD
jgi:hypothetical protein